MPNERLADERSTFGDRTVGRDDDELGRKAFAQLLATHLTLSRSDAGFVMSLTGPWGSGKSSVLKMVTEELHERGEPGKKPLVVDFNPWFFSGTGQLTAGFLLKLAAQLPRDLKQRAAEAVAERLRGYADTFGTLQGRLRSALAQLRLDRECYLGVWWANGAPLSTGAQILDRAAAPKHVAGVVSIGQGVAVPWSEINCFIVPMERGLEDTQRVVDSTIDDRLAGLVLDRFDSSSGVRPTLLRAPDRDRMILLRRDGRRRIFPFNLLFDADPRVLPAPHRPSSPVQDTAVHV